MGHVNKRVKQYQCLEKKKTQQEYGAGIVLKRKEEVEERTCEKKNTWVQQKIDQDQECGGQADHLCSQFQLHSTSK